MHVLTGLILGTAVYFYFIILKININFQQENLIYTADPESFEVNTKDMDSTLSRASRAIKKTSKKVNLSDIIIHRVSKMYFSEYIKII